MNKTIYEDIYEGDSKDAMIKCPFLSHGLHLKVLQSIRTTIGIFPLEKSFYVATFKRKNEGFDAIIEETNSIKMLNIIIKRESDGCQYLDIDQIRMVKIFLNSNKCKDIIYIEGDILK